MNITETEAGLYLTNYIISNLVSEDDCSTQNQQPDDDVSSLEQQGLSTTIIKRRLQSLLIAIPPHQGLQGAPPPLSAVLVPLVKVNNSQPSNMVVGKLVPDANCGLAIEDKTGTISCMFQELDVTHVGTFILVSEFYYFANPFHSYIEVIKYHSLTDSTHCAAVGAHKLSGVVAAVSTPVSSGDNWYVFIELHTPEGKNNLVITIRELVYVYRYLTIGGCYMFTGMKDSVLNKGKYNQHRVMVTTPYSTIVPMEQCSINVPLLPSCTESPRLISYQGLITNILVPEVGLLELDNRVRVYMCYISHFTDGEGIRPGTQVLLSNVHLLTPPPKWKHLAGFVCCVYSSVQFTKLSTTDTTSDYMPFITHRNKLRKLLSKYCVGDVAFLLELYQYCRDWLECHSFGCILSILKAFILLAELTPSSNYKDSVSMFLSSPHCCNVTSEDRLYTLEGWSLPSISQLTQTILPRHLMSNTISCNNGVGSLVGFSWTEAIIEKVVIIGRLISNRMGGVSMSDNATTTTLDMLLLPTILPHVGHYLLITKARAIQEHTHFMSTPSTEHAHIVSAPKPPLSSVDSNESSTKVRYIIPSQWESISVATDSINLSNPTTPFQSTTCLYFIVITKNSPVQNCIVSETKITFDILVHIATDPAVLTDPNQRSKDTESILRISDVHQYYSILRPGCLYSLVYCNDSSSNSLTVATGHCSLPSVIPLVSDYVIEFMEEGKEWQVVQCIDVCEIFNSFPKPLNRTTAGDKVVSVCGVISNRSYRVGSFGSAHSLHQFTLALDLKSSLTPDTIIVYIYPDQFPPPIGLVPGAQVKFIQVTLKYSRSFNNPYCVYCGGVSSVEIACFPVTAGTGGGSKGVAPSEYDPPIILLNELIQHTSSSRRSNSSIVCLFGRITAIQYLEVNVGCVPPGHQYMARVGGRSGGGLQQDKATAAVAYGGERTVKIEGSATFSDGSATDCMVYFDGSCAQNLLKCDSSKWTSLLRAVENTGSVIKYYRIQEQSRNEAEAMLVDIARSNAAVTSEVKLLCRPILTSPTNKSGTDSTRTKKFKVDTHHFYTVEIPTQRLKLKVISVLQINHTDIAGKLYNLYCHKN